MNDNDPIFLAAYQRDQVCANVESMAMTVPAEWLARFFAARDLDGPDGRILCTYRMSEAEFNDLRSAISKASRHVGFDRAAHLSKRFAALFAIYGAEWWRREYRGGAWSYDPIFESIPGLDRAGQLAIAEAIETGMSFWKQKLHSDGRRYFGALVAQGGIPARLLAESRGNIAGVLRTTVKRAARRQWQINEIVELVRDQEERLPRSLQKPVIVRLFAEIVEAVITLKREFGLSPGESANAVAKLDARAPNWRERFPLAMDDDAASSLLNDLVATAVATEEGDGVAILFSIERTLLECDPGQFALTARLLTSPLIELDALQAWVGESEDALGASFVVNARIGNTDEGRPVADGRLAFGAQTKRFSVSQRRHFWDGSESTTEVLLALLSKGIQSSFRAVPGSAALDHLMPWVFNASEETGQLIGQGGLRVKAPCALIAIPPNASVQLTDVSQPDQLATCVGRLAVPERILWRVQGDVRVEIPDEDGEPQIYRICTGSTQSEPEHLVWEGTRLPYPSRPSTAFMDLPRLVRYSEDGERFPVPSSQIEYRTAGTRKSVPANVVRGPVDVIWKVDGEIRFRNRLLVLGTKTPSFRSSDHPKSGRIDLPLDWGIPHCHCESDAIQCEVNFPSVRVTAVDQPPESVALSLSWPGCPVDARIVFPFPASGGRFFDRNGEEMASGQPMGLGRLIGTRLRVFDSNPQAPKRYSVQLELLAKGIPRNMGVVEHLIKLTGASAEIRLFDFDEEINNLFGMSNDLDASVVLRLTANSLPVTQIVVKRFDLTLWSQGFTVTVEPSQLSALTVEDLLSIKISAQRLDDFSTLPVSLIQTESSGVPTGLWGFPPEEDAEFDWLIFPEQGSLISFRPFVLGRSIDEPSEQEADDSTNALERAEESNTQETSEEAVPLTRPISPSLSEALAETDVRWRTHQIALAVQELAENFTHPDWALVEAILDQFAHLPLSVLNLWQAFVGNRRAMVALLMRPWGNGSTRSDAIDFGQRFSREFPFVWESVALNDWIEGARQLKECLAKLVPDSARSDRLWQGEVVQIRAAFPSLDTMLLWAMYKVSGQADEALREFLTPSRTTLAYESVRLWRGADAAVQQRLFAGMQDDERWPEHLASEALEALVKDPSAQRTVGQHVGTLFWPQHNDFKWSVASTPIVLAISSSVGNIADWWLRPDVAIRLRQHRDFNRNWFENTFDAGFRMVLAAGMLLPTAQSPEQHGRFGRR
jgi:hypothetical protein